MVFFKFSSQATNQKNYSNIQNPRTRDPEVTLFQYLTIKNEQKCFSHGQTQEITAEPATQGDRI
ncbi:hypothetical protein F511_45012 [Dorcoceras hygrometricum]|uniref:Uncharacterized protein n=1 Tax=Dorcoceras hygrometricum TaxID=472368 RepID=A0A2Z7A4N1_9LAMI|nr:hypothetical protein F511_45012 [Dorcoceras hygrometricum]